MNIDHRDILDKQKYIFGSLFLLANKLQVIGDQFLAKDGMTIKQWFLTVMISQFPGGSPTLGEVAQLMGSSHQNVKQLAIKLHEKGFLEIEKDSQDGRAIRLKLTEKSYLYWQNRDLEGINFVKELFKDLTEEELKTTYNSFKKIFERIEKWDQ